jgi:hypothetical protein
MRAPRRVWVLLIVLTAPLGGRCPEPKPSPPPPIPTFDQLHIPDPGVASGWRSVSPSNGSFEVLLTRGRGVRVLFLAPQQSFFAVSLTSLDASRTVTPLPENKGTPSPPEAGYFQVISVDTSRSPALYTMYVRSPATLTDPANFDLSVVSQSLRTDVPDSAPMVVLLRQRRVFTVTVSVEGPGRVVSQPGGIQCGRSSQGPLTQCSFDFGPGVVTLAANSVDSGRFREWSGNCIPSPQNGQACSLVLDGRAAMGVKATFVEQTSSAAPTPCAVAPAVPGMRWIDRPICSALAGSEPVRCDGSGYFCCRTGSGDPRCGPNQTLFPPECSHRGINAMLRQPGGCYEVEAWP